MKLEPFRIQTSRLTLAGLKNDGTVGTPIIALHGWLDNAASFIPLSAKLSFDRPFYALELPGHGQSEHRSAACTYHLLENILDVLAFIEVVAGKQPVSLIGHSLGGIIGALVAASAPEAVDKLVLLDSLGPLTDKADQVLPQLRRAVAKARQLKSSRLTVYPDKDKAALVRMVGVGKVTKESAMLLVERGLKEVPGGYSWASDSRLLDPSLLRFSEAQIQAAFAGIECPVSLICGAQGYFLDYQGLNQRLAYLNNVTRHEVQGGHHFHMDGDVQRTADLIDEFLKS